MRHMNPETWVLELPGGESLAVSDLDAHFVLGIPFKGRQVVHGKGLDTQAARIAVGKLMDKSGGVSLTMEFLEEVLLRDYGECLSSGEKEAFQIAFVLYSMSNYLVVLTPAKTFPKWLITNLDCPSKICEFNWCGYVLSVLAHAARHVQAQMSCGSKVVDMFGCTFLLQVLYLDNLNFGPSTPVLLELPRGSIFNGAYLARLIESDQCKNTGEQNGEYGLHKLRVADEVCYTRGWATRELEGGHKCDGSYKLATEMLHDILQFDEKLEALLAPSLRKLSAVTACDIVQTYKEWYPEYTAVFTPLPGDAFLMLDKGKEHDSSQRDEALLMLAKEASRVSSSGRKRSSVCMLHPKNVKKTKALFELDGTSHGFQVVSEDGVLKKLVKRHPPNGVEVWGNLTRVWVHIDYPVPISLPGYNLKTQFSRNEDFSPAMVDAITRASMEADDLAYKGSPRRWRHFLPARFTEAVLSQERKPKYLESDEIMSYFMGTHIQYDVENCRMIIAPVLYHGKWSCFFWDFQRKLVTVLDPTRMDKSSEEVEMHHQHLVNKLTHGLFCCISQFFSGWHFDRTGWESSYPTNHVPICERYDSGLYSVLYSRYFDGDSLRCVPKQGVLIEPRSAILYYLLIQKGNRGYIPQRIKDVIMKI